MQTLESRLAACATSALLGVALASFAIWQVPRPDVWLLLGVATAMLLLGALGVMYIERFPQVSLWGALGSIIIAGLTAVPLIWAYGLAQQSDEPRVTLIGGESEGLLSPTSQSGFSDIASTSMAVSLTAAILGLVIGGLVAYPLVVGKFRGRRIARGAVWVSVFIPAIAVAGPWSAQWIASRQVDTGLALVVTYLVLTVPISAAALLYVGDRLDHRILEQARVDGATLPQRFLRVHMNRWLPVSLGVGGIGFILVWNDLLIASLTTAWRTETVPVFARTITDSGEQAGLLLIWIVPALIALFFAVRTATTVIPKD